MAEGTVVGFSALLASLESGRTPQGTELGGNVLQEQVLLTFAAAGYHAAGEYLRNEYLRPVAHEVFSDRRATWQIAGSEELADELYLTLFSRNKQETFRGKAGLRRWLCIVAKRLLVDKQRRSHAVNKQGPPGGEDMQLKARVTDDPSQELENKELRAGVEEWFGAKCNNHHDWIKRRVLRLWARGVPNKEIAKELNLSPGQISRIRKKALKELRNFLESKFHLVRKYCP